MKPQLIRSLADKVARTGPASLIGLVALLASGVVLAQSARQTDTSAASASPSEKTPLELEAERKPPEPQPRKRFPVGVIQVIDKVTTKTLRFEIPVGGAVRYRSLTFSIKACENTAPDESARDSAAYLVVHSNVASGSGDLLAGQREIHKGWVFASSPGINPFEHPAYDAWLITCKSA